MTINSSLFQYWIDYCILAHLSSAHNDYQKCIKMHIDTALINRPPHIPLVYIFCVRTTLLCLPKQNCVFPCNIVYSTVL